MIAGSLFVEIVPLDFEISYCFSFCEDDADALSEIRFAVFESVILSPAGGTSPASIVIYLPFTLVELLHLFITDGVFSLAIILYV